MQLSLGDAESSFTALKSVVRLVNGKSTFLFHSYADKYFEAFNRERKEGVPGSILVRGRQIQKHSDVQCVARGHQCKKNTICYLVFGKWSLNVETHGLG